MREVQLKINAVFEPPLPSAQFPWCCYGIQGVLTIPVTVAAAERSLFETKTPKELGLRKEALCSRPDMCFWTKSKLHTLHWRRRSLDHGILLLSIRIITYISKPEALWFVTFLKLKKQILSFLVHVDIKKVSELLFEGLLFKCFINRIKNRHQWKAYSNQ